MFIVSTVILSFSNTKILAADTNEYPDGFYDPSPNAQRIGPMYTTSGIIKQVQENYYVKSGETVEITADGRRSLIDVRYGKNRALTYEWRMASDSEDWHVIGSNSKHLSFTPEKDETYWIQLKISYPFWEFMALLTGGDPTIKYIYSNVAKVNITSEAIKTDQLEITTDNDYIYNRPNFFNGQSTYATAHTKPFNTTEQPTWALRDKDSELAYIDEDGKITANVFEGDIYKSGEIQISATTNHNFFDADFLNATKTIQVGGGLNDVQSAVGNEATFRLMGFREDEPLGKDVKITWHRKERGNTDYVDVTSENASKNPLFYKIPDASPQDDESFYKATIETQVDRRPYKYETNPAKLLIAPANKSDILIETSIDNNTFTSHEDTTSDLYNVVANDEIKYYFKITNFGKNKIQSSELKFHLIKGSEIVEINANMIPEFQEQGEQQEVSIPTGSLMPKQSVEVQIKTSTPTINKRHKIITQPVFVSHYTAKEPFIVEGSELSLNYLTNNVELAPKNITFEPIRPSDNSYIKYRLPTSDIPIHIDDQRRNKSKAIGLFLQQDTPFINQDNEVLPANLFFHRENHAFLDISEKTLISTSDQFEALKSVEWSHDNGLLLHLNSNNNLVSGDYQAQLSWSIDDSI